MPDMSMFDFFRSRDKRMTGFGEKDATVSDLLTQAQDLVDKLRITVAELKKHADDNKQGGSDGPG